MSVPEPVDLRRLLSYLSLTRQYIAPLDALQIVRTTGPTEALPAELEGTIESIRRVAYAGNDYRQSGLFEFQLALLFMDGKRNLDAATQFGQARLQWNLVGDPDLICLACFAQGVAWHRGYDYEKAAPNYLETKRQIDAALAEAVSWSGLRPANIHQEFWDEIDDLLNEAMAEIQESMGRYFRARLLPLIVVQPPIIADDLTDAGIRKKTIGGCSLFFDISEPLRFDEYREIILPVVEGIDEINNALSRLLDLDQTGGLTVEQRSRDDSLEIRLGGCLVETTVFCERLFEDRRFQHEYGEQARQLERATVELETLKKRAQPHQPIDAVKRDELETEIRQMEMSLGEVRVRKARGLVDQCAPGVATAERRSAIALMIAPSLKVLVESLTRNSVSLSPDKGA
jgi:hypothetical protein